MFASNDFGDDNNVFFQFSPTFLHHEDSCFQFLPPPPQVAETLNVDKSVSSNANAGGSGKKVTGISGRTPRKRSGKKDRHSKIVTAQGTRDRRMRLSLEIARKFFNLQDMLGFDKASKTVDWLLRKSKEAINDLSKGCSGKNRSASSISDCDVVGEVNEGFFKGKSSSGNVSKKQKKVKKSSCETAFHQLVRDSRARARERARERTLEKKRRLDKSKQCFVQVNPHDLKSSSPDETRGGSQNTFMEVLTSEYEEPSVSHPPKHPAPNKDDANKSPLAINSPAMRFNSQNNFAIPQGVCFNNTSIPNFQETWCTDIAKVHTTYCANGSLGNAQNPLSGSIFLSASDFRLQSQFLNINQFYATPW